MDRKAIYQSVEVFLKKYVFFSFGPAHSFSFHSISTKTLASSRLKENTVANSPAGGCRLTALKTVEQALTCFCLDNHSNTTSCAGNKNLHVYSSPNDLQNMWNHPLWCPHYLHVAIQEK